MSQIENIGKKDVMWSYAATFFTIGAGLILLPFMLNQMPADVIGIWTLFQTVILLVIMLDFGFRPAFARNLSYVFAGAKTLKREGVWHAPAGETPEVDYALLKGTLVAMRRLYRWMALGTFVVLGSLGTLYFAHVFDTYSGDKQDAWVAWFMLLVACSWDLYTYYYDALLTGKGLIKRAQQIAVLWQSVYLVLAIAMIYCGFGLVAIMTARLVSLFIRRILAYRSFYTTEMKACLADVMPANHRHVLKAIAPNAIKLGMVSLGAFGINRSAMFLGGYVLPLEVMASYGISMQVMDVIVRCGQAYYQSYLPKLAQYRVEQNYGQLRCLYRNSLGAVLVVFFGVGTAFVLCGPWALRLIGSQTTFLPATMLCAMLGYQLLEQNHALSMGFLTADNKIPFFVPSLITAVATILLLSIGLFVLPQWGVDLGVWTLILAPALAQICYQNWKWPAVIINELYFRHANE